jgi:signal transduction histidine kinase
MNRRILIQVTAPAAIIGFILLGTCLVSAWFVSQLQINRSTILSQNVTTLESAQQLEILLRRLHFYCFLYLIDPDQSLLGQIDTVNEQFQQRMDEAVQTAATREESDYLKQIQDGYTRYRTEFERLRAEVARTRPRNFRELADANPIRHALEPCDQLLRINKDMMVQTSQESDRISRTVRTVLILLGLAGPASGLIIGFGMARGLSRSIYQLSVHVHDVAQRLDQDVASVSVAADGDIQTLDQQLQYVVQRVEEVAQRLQQHQREIIHTQQLSAMGQLAASVAHEVRNPLTSIKLLVESGLRSGLDSLTLEDLKVIHGEVVRLEQTVRNFLDFARPPVARRARGDLREVVSQAVDLTRARARQQDVEIETDVPAGPVEADVDAGQLCTVLVNLCINALDVMPQGGKLTLSLRRSADGLVLAVADTGPGIAAGMLGRLFTPFVSTKATGSGLGLSISRRIIREHGGEIAGGNRPEGGACFTIRLPAAAREPLAASRLLK